MADLVLDTAIIIHLITTEVTDMDIIQEFPEIQVTEEVLQTIQAIDLHLNSTILHPTEEVR
jgi:hypothetical protein